MLRIHGDRISLLAALTAHWADQQLQIPQTLRQVAWFGHSNQVFGFRFALEVAAVLGTSSRERTRSPAVIATATDP
jgi:hypothetical protein